MSSSYSKGFRSVYKLNAHVVFVTKYRKKAINFEILNRLKVINIFMVNLIFGRVLVLLLVAEALQ